MAARFAGRKMGEYKCNRCKQEFSLLGDTYYASAVPKGRPVRVAAWVGDPL